MAQKTEPVFTDFTCGEDTLKLIPLIPNKGLIPSPQTKLRWRTLRDKKETKEIQCFSQAWQQSPWRFSWQRVPDRRAKNHSAKRDKVCCHCIRSSCLVVQLKKRDECLSRLIHHFNCVGQRNTCWNGFLVILEQFSIGIIKLFHDSCTIFQVLWSQTITVMNMHVIHWLSSLPLSC